MDRAPVPPDPGTYPWTVHPTEAPPRRIRSFHPRRSRTSPAAASALVRLLPTWGVDVTSAPARLGELFEPPGPVVLEIGSGMGEATRTMALADPGTGIVAVDVHTPGIGALLAACERDGVGNVRVCVGDAVELMDRLAPGSLDGIRIYFPDPWPKVRHHKRRLVQPEFVHRAALLLRPGGTLHLATDIDHYAEQMVAVCRSEPLLATTRLDRRPSWRPVTRFETRGEAAGRRSADILAVRRGDVSGRSAG